MVNIRKWFPLVLGILLVVSIGMSISFYRQLQDLKANPKRIAQEEAQALIAKVGQLIVLPEGEEPTIATVQEPERLKEQAFFAAAKRGDRVLIYTNARKAILYSVADHKIVEVAPINIGNQNPPAPAKTPESSGAR